MQITTSILAFTLTITSAQAATVEGRQAGSVTARLYHDRSCQESNFDRIFVFNDVNSSGCTLTNFDPAIKCMRVTANSATRQCECAFRVKCYRVLSPHSKCLRPP